MLVKYNKQSYLVGLTILVIICGLAIWANWLKTLTLGADSGRGLFEAYRLSQGEMPYRDFTLQYPPLSTWLLGLAFRSLGSTFMTAQIVFDVLGVLITFLTWHLARKLLPESLALAATAALILQGANQYIFFSLSIYSHAPLTGMIGILLLLCGVVDYLKNDGPWKPIQIVQVGFGSLISLLSKPEFIFGTIVCIGVLAIVDRQQNFYNKSRKSWLYQYVWVAMLAIVPAMLIYILIANLAGLNNLLAGLTGYGQGTQSCPWWPTGLGLFGSLVALGQVVVITALFSLPHALVLYRHYKQKYILMWLGAILGVIGFIYYYYYWHYVLHTVGQTMPLLFHISDLLQLRTVLLPALWFAIPFWFIQTKHIATSIFQDQPITPNTSIWYILLGTGLALTLRNLFGSHLTSDVSVALAGFPILVIIATYFLVLLQQTFEKITIAKDKTIGLNQTMWLKFRPNLALIVIVTYAGLHILGVVKEGLTGYKQYATLNTMAGPIKVAEQGDILLYDYIINHSQSEDFVLNISYSAGGINFATHRPSPIATTQFGLFAPTPEFLNVDLERLQRNPPKIVVAANDSSLGAGYGLLPSSLGHGSLFITRCSFPRLVWVANEPAYPLDTPFPVVEYIRANYKPKTQISSRDIWSIWMPQ